jgi:flagellar biosynthetic protein FlhB
VSGDKTEKATPRRSRDLRKKGVSARSMELPSAVSLLCAAMVLPVLVTRLASALRTDLVTTLSTAGDVDVRHAMAGGHNAAVQALSSLSPVLGFIGLASLASSVAVTRSRPGMTFLRPKVNRLSPKSGVKRLVSTHNVVELVKTIVKLSAVFMFGYPGVRAAMHDLERDNGSNINVMLGHISRASVTMFTHVAGAVLLIGVADAWWSRRKYNKQAKMTKQEVRDEHKATEGDPHIKGEIRQRQRRMARSRMIAAVPKADVVLANPTHIAVALQYEPGSVAPRVVAVGAGVIAQRIKQVARDNNVPVIENKPLARALHKACHVGDLIPVELYRAVAEVLAVVFAAKRRRRWAS